MDLKGSLVDTNLKIYPSSKLLEYLKSITTTDIPSNVADIVAGKKTKTSNSNEETKAINIELNNADFANLNKIKDYVLSKETKNNNDENDLEHPNDSKKIITEDVESAEINEESEKAGGNKKNTSKKEDLESNDAEESEKTKEEKQETEITKLYLTTQDIEWLYTYLQKKRNNLSEGNRKVPYLHELLKDSEIEMPSNAIIKRNPVLEARCVKLRAQQDAREYRKMTKTVDNVRISYPEDSISYQIKQLNRQLIAIGQFILSIFAGFMFGFRGVQWMAGNMDFGVRMLMGVMCALIIALAEIYFLAKKLNEELSASQAQTIQIGGPPKLASDQNYFSYLNAPEPKKEKPHQD